MKKLFALLLCAVLLFAVCPALADTYYVATEDSSPLSLRDEHTNAVLTAIPCGVPVMPDPEKSTDICAYVTYDGHSGLALWRYLTRTPPAVQPGEDGTQTAAAPEPRLPEGQYQLTAVGALITHVNSNAAGVSSMVVTEADNVKITAQIPKNTKIDYWVINGVRYDFLKNVRILRMTKFDAGYTVEVVYTKTQSETLLSPEAIQAARTGEQLTVTCKKCRLSHLKSNGRSGGGWVREFDFTGDYQNRATSQTEPGGQMSFRVRADNSGSAAVPAGTAVVTRTVRGWRFNGTEVYPNVNIEEFRVNTLNTSMTYEPIMGGSSVTFK